MLIPPSLNPAELTLLDCLASGQPLGHNMAAGHPVRTTVIRAILTGLLMPGLHGQPDPLGLQLDGISIDGDLNLRQVRTGIALRLERCVITGHVDLTDAQLPALSLRRSTLVPGAPLARPDGYDIVLRLERAHIGGQLSLSGATVTNPTGPALGADGMIVDSDTLLGGEFTGDGELGAVRLLGAHIGGQLNLRGATITNPTGPALVADKLTVDSSALLGGEFTGDGAHGAVRLLGAHIGGQLNLAGATITNPTGPALAADNLTVDSDTWLGGEFTGDGEHGAIRLSGAHIGGQLRLDGATITNPTGPALSADKLTVDGSASLGGEFTGDGELGAVRLSGAHIGGQLSLAGATITNPTGPALSADNLTVDSTALLGGEFNGDAVRGAVRLLGAHIGGQLNLAGATITNPTGPALAADGMIVDSDTLLGGEFTGDGAHGAVRLSGAHIGGQLNLAGATITNPTGPALSADGIIVDSDTLLGGEFTGDGAHGAVRLLGAHIGGQLNLRGATITNPTGPALVADRITVDESVSLVGAGRVHGGPVAVSLAGARLGRMSLVPTMFSATSQLNLYGAIYQGRPGPDHVLASAWCVMLRTSTPAYAAQPYQQLAAAYLAEGHLGDQRTVLIAQQEDRRTRVLNNAAKHTHGRAKRLLQLRSTGLVINRLVIGYGYRPARAAFWLLAILTAAIVLTTLAARTHDSTGHPSALRPALTAGQQPQPCSEAEQLGLATRIAIPVLSNVTQGNCQLTTTRNPGQWYALVGFLLLALAWATATLTVIGYTNLIRRT